MDPSGAAPCANTRKLAGGSTVVPADDDVSRVSCGLQAIEADFESQKLAEINAKNSRGYRRLIRNFTPSLVPELFF
jgi:hypothetical protein